MKNKRAIIIAAIVAGFAVFAHNLFIKSRIEQVIGPYEKVDVVVSTADILRDTIIDESMLTSEKVPKKFVQPGSITTIDQAVGRLALTTIKKGQQVLDASLIKYTESYLSHEIPSGMRAITIAVTDITGVAGLIKPGNYVDILITHDYSDKQTVDKRTKTIFQNVKILAVDRNLTKISNPLVAVEDTKKERVNNVTIALPPREVQRIVLAQELGMITLALRKQLEEPGIQELPEDNVFSVTGTKEPLKAQDKPPYYELRGTQFGTRY